LEPNTYTKFFRNTVCLIALEFGFKYLWVANNPFIGESNLSRARGTKAQNRRLHQEVEIENTIDFRKASKQHTRQIELRPKSLAQEKLILSLLDPATCITVAVGPAGTGKSYLATLAALQALRANKCQKIILTRPAVGVEDEKHGFLPGTLNQKMEPWTRPLLDIIKEFYNPRDVVRLIEDEVIEISPLAFMRGRTFKNAFIVADEMQNATPNQLKMLLTRIGVGSKIVVTGDVEQTDRTSVNNGLLDLCARLNAHGYPGLQVCELGARDVQRHPIIASVLKLYGS
jgi:phosphate starvation-inducible protein PhoH and related proteins